MHPVFALAIQGGAVLAMALLGLAFGIGLAICSRVLAVRSDPRIEHVLDVLPGSNCGACGYGGCAAYAEAVVTGEDVPCNLCVPGGNEVAQRVADVMGVEVEEVERRVTVSMCQGGNNVETRYEYDGVHDCRAAHLLAGGPKACDYGCIGLGTCAAVCPVDAIRMGDEGLPVVLEDRCIACGDCVRACPRDLYQIVPVSKNVHNACSSHDMGAKAKKICPRACIACRRCERTCKHDAVHVIDNLAVFDYDKCVVCGDCVPVCPTGAIIDLGDTRKATHEEIADAARA